MSEAQKRRLRIVEYVCLTIYMLLTVPAILLVEKEPATTWLLFFLSLPFVATALFAATRLSLHGKD